jgi:hypothetical protein
MHPWEIDGSVFLLEKRQKIISCLHDQILKKLLVAPVRKTEI